MSLGEQYASTVMMSLNYAITFQHVEIGSKQTNQSINQMIAQVIQ